MQLETKIDNPTTDHDWGAQTQHPYLIMSVAKVFIMTLCTFTLYNFYWTFKQWSSIRKVTGENLSPFWRTFFTVIWTFGLANRIDATARERTISLPIPLVVLACVYAIGNYSSRLPDPFWLLGLVIPPTVLAIFQSCINKTATEGGAGKQPLGLTRWDIAGIVLGLIFLTLVLMGLALPEVED